VRFGELAGVAPGHAGWPAGRGSYSSHRGQPPSAARRQPVPGAGWMQWERLSGGQRIRYL